MDEIVLFKPLTLSDIKRIIDLQLKQLRVRLSERHLELELTEPAKEYIAREGYDPVYGARPLKRFLQRHLRNGCGLNLIGITLIMDLDREVERLRGELDFRRHL